MLGPLDVSNHEVAERIIAIQQLSYRKEADLIGFDGIPQMHETIADLRDLPLLWLGSWENDELVGVMAWVESSGTCEIDRLAVHPAFFRRGHGRSLVGSLAHFDTVIVTTGTKNIPARRLYQSLGFIAVDDHEVEPGVTMTRFIRPG
jgi:ribosomal protein S18 acetylase RimI-like enzyme